MNTSLFLISYFNPGIKSLIIDIVPFSVSPRLKWTVIFVF